MALEILLLPIALGSTSFSPHSRAFAEPARMDYEGLQTDDSDPIQTCQHEPLQWPFFIPCSPEPISRPSVAIREVGEQLLLGYLDRGVFASSDGGDHWKRLTPEGTCHQPILNFWQNSGIDRAICVETINSSAEDYYCSGDQGLTWRSARMASIPSSRGEWAAIDSARPAFAIALWGGFSCLSDCDGSSPAHSVAWTHDLGRTWLTRYWCLRTLKAASKRDLRQGIVAIYDEDEWEATKLARINPETGIVKPLLTAVKAEVKSFTSIAINPFSEEQGLLLARPLESSKAKLPLLFSPDYFHSIRGLPAPSAFLDETLFLNAAGDLAGVETFTAAGKSDRLWYFAVQSGIWRTYPLPGQGGRIVPTSSGRLFYTTHRQAFVSKNLGASWRRFEP